TLRPIAGTRRRGASHDEDLRLEAEMRADPKECAEHTMLVDLGRNDIGRVSRIGTVRVEKLMETERFSHVMHMTSEVGGLLKPGLGAVDAFTAAFPAGTLSGAPKIRAMEIIDELEGVQRGPYGGADGEVLRNDDLSAAEILERRPERLVLSPGPCTPNEAGVCLELIDRIRSLSRPLPLLGVCLGHQSIGQAFGARVIRAREPVH